MSDTGRRAFADRMRRLIRTNGPISLAQFMAEANAHYYAHRDPLGVSGDFITAPEISQMFGEMIGGAIADLAIRADAHEFAYVELGPGRGTLAADAMRVIGRAGLSPAVHFVEGSPALREKQRERFAEATFHDAIDTLPADRPLIVVANEFFDALPIRQLVRTERGWRERMVGLDGERLLPVAGATPMDAAIPDRFAQAAADSIVETSPAASAIMRDLARRLVAQGGAAIVIDYGHGTPQTGSTFQAVRAQRRADPFAEAGDADLTALVDFCALADAAHASGAQAAGPVGQGQWLTALGIDQRAAALASANPDARTEVESALARLTGADQMGDLFKVLAIHSPAWPRPAGFTDT